MRQSARQAMGWTVLWAAVGLAATPQLSLVLPRGAQRGTEVTATFSGARLADAEEILFYEPGITAANLKAEAGKVEATLKITPNCRLGEHTVRVRTKSGISELRTFWVGVFAAVEEKEPNTIFEQPQPIGKNITITGVITGDDVDYFLYEAKKGERITAVAEGLRLGVALFDPHVAIFDLKRFELASDDDTPLLLQDSMASILAPEDGKYVIAIRDSSYGGANNFYYRLHVGDFAQPKIAYPAGGKVGSEVEASLIGDVTGEIKQKVKVPAATEKDFGIEVKQGDLVSPQPLPFRISNFDNVLEAEPNDEVAKATPAPMSAPLAFNGVINKAGDVDFFKFAATKGQVYDVSVHCRSIRSPMDPVLSILNAQGNQLAANDDAGGPDSYLRFSVPADGEFVLRVVDHLGKGGPNYVYRIELTPVAPTLVVAIPEVARYSQDRQVMSIPRGNRFLSVMSLARKDFAGELKLMAQNLPKGVTMTTGAITPGSSTVPILFEAAADAPLSATKVRFETQPADANLKVASEFESIALLVNYRNNVFLWKKKVDEMFTAVTEEAPFSIAVVEPKVPLAQGGSMQLKVVATRKGDFKAPINVSLPFLPPNVNSVPQVTIPEGQTEIIMPLNSTPKADVASWKLAAQANADANGALWVASPFFNFNVAEGFVNAKIEMTATEQGKSDEVVVKLEQLKPFAGKAKIQLVGVPAKVTGKLEMEITKDSTEVVFPIVVDATAAVGQHKTLFCEITVTENGEPIVQQRGQGGVLRIDAPPPPKKNAPQVAGAPAKEQPKTEPGKRLSRLEQLRQQQQGKGGSE